VDLNKLVEASKRRKAEEKARRRAEEESAARAQADAARASRSGSRRPTPKLQIRASGGDADGPGATGRDKGNAFGSRNPVTGRSPTGKNVWTAIAEYNVKMAEVKTQEEWQEKLARRKKFNETLQQQVAAKRRIKERERRVQVRSRKLVDTDFHEHVKVEEEKKKRLLDAALVEKRMRDQQMVAKRQREYKAREEVEAYGKRFIAKCLRELQEEKDKALAEKRRKAVKNEEQKRALEIQLQEKIKAKERAAAYDKKLAADYVKMVNDKEEARRQEYRDRKARIKAKCDAMGDTYKKLADDAAAEEANTQSSYEKHLKKRAAELKARRDLAKRRTVEQINWLDRMMREKNEKKLRQYQEDMKMARKMQMDADNFFQEQRDEEKERKRLQREFRKTLDQQIKVRSEMPAIDEEPDILLLNKSLLKTCQQAGVVMGDTIDNLPDRTQRAIVIKGQGKQRRYKLAKKRGQRLPPI
jgi:hypothetical protein